MQREQIKRAHCSTCEKNTKFVRHVTAMGCGDLIMIMVTCGAWLIGRFLLTPKYICDNCGNKEGS
jgi:hypothetical protein